MIARVLRFSGVGGLATLVHVAIAMAVEAGLGPTAMMANLAGWAGAVTVSYFGHLHITFSVSPAHAIQAPRFILTSMAGLILSSSVVGLVSALGGSFALAMALVAVGVPAITFVLLKLWVFDNSVHAGGLPVLDVITPICAGAGFLAVFWGRTIHHDVVWYHIATRKWLDGAALYNDIMEVNPPLNFYLTLPVIALADLLNINDANAQFVFVALLLIASLILMACQLRAIESISQAQRFFLLAGSGTILTVLSLWNTSQREHLFVLLLLPWLTAQIEPKNGSSRSMAGLATLGAIGMCLKPFFVVFPASVLIFNAFKSRSIAPLKSVSAVVFLVTGLAYICFVALIHPAYFTNIVPMAMLVYEAYGSDFIFVLLKARVALSVLVFAGVWAVFRRNPATGVSVLFLAAFAGVVSYFWQGTGFTYHGLPFLLFGAIGCLFACLDRRSRMIAVVALLTLSFLALQRGHYRNFSLERIVQTVDREGAVGSLFVVTTHVSAGPIAAKSVGAEWPSFYPAQWLVPGAIDALAQTDCTVEPERCRDLEAIADQNRDDIIATIATGQPSMIVFDKNSGYFKNPHFDWHEWLDLDPDFAPLMIDYVQVSEDKKFTYWTRTQSVSSTTIGEHFGGDTINAMP